MDTHGACLSWRRIAFSSDLLLVTKQTKCRNHSISERLSSSTVGRRRSTEFRRSFQPAGGPRSSARLSSPFRFSIYTRLIIVLECMMNFVLSYVKLTIVHWRAFSAQFSATPVFIKLLNDFPWSAEGSSDLADINRRRRSWV